MAQLINIMTVSLSATAIILCLLVLKHWMPEARRAVRERRDAADWLVLGVTMSFTGVLLNMAWWGTYRALELYRFTDAQAWMYEQGPWVNLVTRQTAVIAAAYFQLKAYHMFSKYGSRNPAYHFWWTLGASALMALAMFLTTGGYK